eukprot:2312630-Pyramimonas_sp.AAC.1
MHATSIFYALGYLLVPVVHEYRGVVYTSGQPRELSLEIPLGVSCPSQGLTKPLLDGGAVRAWLSKRSQRLMSGSYALTRPWR